MFGLPRFLLLYEEKTMRKILDDPAAIRQWTEARGGYPIMMDIPEPGGSEQSLLQLSFGQHALNADHNEGPDRVVSGFDLVDWDAWLAALKAQDLVLVVDDDLAADRQINFRFMSRGEADAMSGE